MMSEFLAVLLFILMVSLQKVNVNSLSERILKKWLNNCWSGTGTRWKFVEKCEK